jgi:hypothetical protein
MLPIGSLRHEFHVLPNFRNAEETSIPANGVARERPHTLVARHAAQVNPRSHRVVSHERLHRFSEAKWEDVPLAPWFVVWGMRFPRTR